MKPRYLAVLTVGLLTTSVFAEEAPTTTLSQKDKLSYSFGQSIGNRLKQQGTEVNLDMLVKGMKDVLSGEKPLLTEQEVNQVLTDFQKESFAKQLELRKQMAAKNQKEGETFLAENQKKPGVVTTNSGLQYKVITEGKGKTPKATDSVTTHYKGTLIDGTEFDSSYSRNEPATFPVSGVIPGWTEALQLMKEGGKLQLFVPSKLAYGEQGYPPKIQPNSTLIFEIELLSVKEEKKEEEKKELSIKEEKKEDVKKDDEKKSSDTPPKN